MHPESLGVILRMKRFKRNLSQQQVCDVLEIKLSTLSRIEDNKRVRESTIKKLMDFYELNEEKAPLD